MRARILTWSWNNAARLWDASSGQTLLTLTHQNAVDTMVFGPADAPVYDAAYGAGVQPG